MAREEEGDEEGEVEEEAKWKTFTTEQLALSFDYPEGWVVSSRKEGEDYYTMVVSPMGLTLELLEEFEGWGLGGGCGDEDPVLYFLKKEADIEGFSNLSVASTTERLVNIDSSSVWFWLGVTGVKNLGGGRSVKCSEGMHYNWLGESSGIDYKREGLVKFEGRFEDRLTNAEEYGQAVEILASLRQE